MPTRHERSSEKKFVRLSNKKVKIHYFKGKSQKHHCAVCKKILHGVAHSASNNDVSKLSKTQKRPSVPFGGVLCTNCRVMVFEEAVKINSSGKKMDDSPIRIRNFVQMAMQQVGRGG